MYLCLSALAESSSGRCGTFVCYCWMMLRVDGCLNEDPGPLPGPRKDHYLMGIWDHDYMPNNLITRSSILSATKSYFNSIERA